MNFLKSLIAFIALAVAAPLFAQGRDLPDFTRLVEEEGPAVVNISATQTMRRSGAVPQFPGMENEEGQEFFRRFFPQRPQPGPGQGPQQGPRQEARSLGSGFIISKDGFILTNEHVVEGADEITVKLTDKREFKAKVIGADKRTDIALIKIEPGGSLPTVKLGDPGKLKVGEWVIAIGSPFGFENTVTAGIISGKGRVMQDANLVPFLQTDVAINIGNSGGPLFNMRGEVVGINSRLFSPTGTNLGIAFAIPIDVALDVQQQLQAKGRVSRGRIGVVIQEVSRDLATSFNLDRPRGALVVTVEKGSPAEKAGVEASDIITKFNGKPVESQSDLPRFVGATRPGSKSELEVWRKGSTKQLAITVGELQDERIASTDETPRTPKPTPLATNRLGIAVSELTAKQKEDLKLASGLVVMEVRPEARAEVRRGDILLTLVHKGQHTELKSVDQLNQLLAGLDKNSVITLKVRRGDSMAFVTVNGLTDKG
ncbi:MAG TPA: DegQ family serine endoprotease [Burkholderiales bacterium]|jgi:serine protease Do|nr:DegQ family serine endoprotease [Burkholderiales bacterium]